MSRLIDQVGLTAGVGLTDRAGLYKFGTFDPLALNPYAFFDGESYKGTLENPTLDLDPSNPDSLDVITATRAGVATYTDSSGLIQSANPNTTRVDYVQGEQLTPTKYQQLEQTGFSLWAHARTSGTANAAISPDGQNNATYVEQNAGQTNAGSIYRFDAAVTGVFTLSVYAKKKEKDFVVLHDSNVGRTYFNLDTGTVGTVASGNTANIEDAGNGWFRCSTTFTASSGAVTAFYVGDNDNNSVVTDGGGIYVWGPQLEEGTTATTFVENTTGNPKFITGATFGPRSAMILVEPSATNILTHSEDFGNSVWKFANAGSSTVVDVAEAPNGTTTADAIIEDTSSSNHRIMGWNSNWQMTSGTDYTFSVFLKPNGRNKVQLSGSGLSARLFDLRGTHSQMERLADGWVRCFITGTATVTGIFSATVYMVEDTSVNYTGDGTSGVYIWGAQLETGSVATSYIPTSGSAVTRAADKLVISGSDFTDAYNASEGTFYVESSTNSDTTAYIFEASYNVGNPYGNSHVAHFNASNNLKVLSRTSANVQYGGQSLATYANNQLTRLAYSYKQSDFRVSFNGEAEPTPSGSQVPSADINQLYLGDAHITGAAPLNGRIRRLIFWPYHSENL